MGMLKKTSHYVYQLKAEDAMGICRSGGELKILKKLIITY
jgi:hypothetical protein